MWYVLLFLVFVVAVLSVVFAEDGFMNRHLVAYQKTINEPWLNRTVALLHTGK